MLSNKALLIYVSISQWTGRKLDRKATATVANAHATKGAAGNYTKKLLPGAKELDRVNQVQGLIRKFFYEQTLPWFSDGARIISSKNYLPFTAEFSKLKSQFESAVSDFIAIYPQLQASAQSSLGSLYNAADYPSADRLLRAFQCEMNVLPLPDVKDFRTEVSDAEKRAFIDKMKSVEATAMQDCWTRLHEVVQKAAARLAQPEYSVRDSLIENIAEICALLPRLNVTDNPDLESARVKVETAIAKMKPDDLRENPKERQDAAAKLAEITRSMGAFMGAKGGD